MTGSLRGSREKQGKLAPARLEGVECDSAGVDASTGSSVSGPGRFRSARGARHQKRRKKSRWGVANKGLFWFCIDYLRFTITTLWCLCPWMLSSWVTFPVTCHHPRSNVGGVLGGTETGELRGRLVFIYTADVPHTAWPARGACL